MQQGLEWYVNSWFSSYVEVHSAELGVLSGLLVGVLLALGFRRTGAVVLIGLYIFAIGLFEPLVLLPTSGRSFGSHAVQLKPWYFLVGLLVTAGVVEGGRRLLFGSRRSPATTSVLLPFEDRD